jgi:glycosyltransferase involved in cell wall biosynthesis
MPCYNAVESLPMALASLIAQSYSDWECILVDDGSSDHPERVVAQADDERIRFIRLNENQGAGRARQVALDAARGDYFGMLDADDWYYPDKLLRQVEVLESAKDPVLASSGVAVLDRAGNLSGVRLCGPPGTPPPVLGPVDRLRPPRLSRAPCLIRMEAAREAGFRASFRRSEDSDFLLRVLWGRTYVILPEVAYVYDEMASASRREVLAGYRYRMRLFWSYRRRHPLAALSNVADALAKQTLYRFAFRLGLADRLIARRSRPPSPVEREQYERARETVTAIRLRRFAA